ncbi:MAG: hypothetical protein JST06_07000 [Bacteroidetes bacterium]|nr:hypothetical protein [Bacteroidota bacterium]MBS1629497.1 hypothetical protein [Bacteroidota bacterium]
MKYMILAALAVIELASCSARKGPDAIFSDYLQRVHHVQIPEGKHTYVVFPECLGCKGCSAHAMDYLATHHFQDVTVICGNDNADYLEDASYPVLIDSQSEIEHLNLQTQNVAILTTRNGELEKIISLQANNLDSSLISYFGKK